MTAVALLLLPALALAAKPTPGLSESQARAHKAYEAVLSDPFSEDAVKAVMAVLPKHGDTYVVEGDLLLSEKQLRAYLIAQSERVTAMSAGGELIVNTVAGRMDYWETPEDRKLTYAVDRQSFSDEAKYKLVVDDMKQATKEWVNACRTCGVSFTHDATQDAAPSLDKVKFIVRGVDAGGAYIAAAFFPSYAPARRYLNVDPSYFTTSFERVGVFRHELGHVLGYRHEHIRGVPGCYQEGSSWRPLTAYDPKSVMHYFCGGAGSLNLRLTDLDKAGHKKLYKR